MNYPDIVTKQDEPALFNLFISKCSFPRLYDPAWSFPRMEIADNVYSFSQAVAVDSEITPEYWDGHWKKQNYRKPTEKERNSWQTPPWLFAWLNRRFEFELDAAASEENALCRKFFTIENNALNQSWCDALKGLNKSVFCNPPFSRGSKERFIEKAVEEARNGVTTVMLLPALPAEGWFPWHTANEITFITHGRVNFIHPVTKQEISGCQSGTCVAVFFANAADSSEPVKILNIDRKKAREYGEYILTVDFEDHPVLGAKVV